MTHKSIDPVEQCADVRAKSIVKALERLYFQQIVLFIGMGLIVLLVIVTMAAGHFDVQPVYVVNQPGQAPTLPYGRPYPAP